MSVLDNQQEQLRPLIMGDPPNPFGDISGLQRLRADLRQKAAELQRSSEQARREEIDKILACQDIEELRKMLLYKLAGA